MPYPIIIINNNFVYVNDAKKDKSHLTKQKRRISTNSID